MYIGEPRLNFWMSQCIATENWSFGSAFGAALPPRNISITNSNPHSYSCLSSNSSLFFFSLLIPLCVRGILLGVIWSVALVTKRGGRRSGSEAPHNNKLNTCTVHKQPRRTPAVASLRRFKRLLQWENVQKDGTINGLLWNKAHCTVCGLVWPGACEHFIYYLSSLA